MFLLGGLFYKYNAGYVVLEYVPKNKQVSKNKILFNKKYIKSHILK